MLEIPFSFIPLAPTLDWPALVFSTTRMWKKAKMKDQDTPVISSV